MAGVTHDDGFHEIQLNGKQLVFLFMAVTVVSVVIFLCGVLVGRGVRIDRGLGGETASVQAGNEPAPPPAGRVRRAVGSAPVTPNEGPRFDDAAESRDPPVEKLQPTAEAPVAESGADRANPPPAAPPAPPKQGSQGRRRPVPQPAKAEPPNPALAEPAGRGMAVQVSAFRVRGEAEALANRLVGKGYKAYVVPPAPVRPRSSACAWGSSRNSARLTASPRN